MVLTIDINGSCNQNCEFCYQNLDGSILPESEILRIVDESSSTETVELGGGEPFADSRIVGLIKSIRGRGRNVHVSTDGVVIPDGLLALEKRIRDGTQIQVSLNASNAELNSAITGRNYFDRVIGNILVLRDSFPTVVSTVVYGRNIHDVPNIVGLTKSLDIPLRINLAFPVGKGKDVKLLNEREVDQLRGYLLAQKAQGVKVDSPLIHKNNCGALEIAYGIKKCGDCPLQCGKRYVSPSGENGRCEFYDKLAVATSAAEGGENGL